jgi:prepilin-type N-terminal cleavage/methylation domain-containing protein
MRAFSLIEMMLVVAILAVLAALAVPAMGPTVDVAKLEGGAEIVAAFLTRAQAEAMASKRCVRVRLDATQPGTLVAERLNSFDCDTPDVSAPGMLIDASAGLWVELARAKLDASILTIAFDPVPSETSAAALGGGEPDQLRFRPSGRLFSSDATLTDDDGVLKITHAGIAGPARTKKILVEAQGLICVLDRGTDPTGSGNNLGCR